jgi:hypothetical protein
MQKCHNGLKKGYNMIQEDESMEISRDNQKLIEMKDWLQKEV